MKKKELLDKIADMYSAVDEQINIVDTVADDLRRIRRTLEELPSEVDEIEDDEKEVEET